MLPLLLGLVVADADAAPVAAPPVAQAADVAAIHHLIDDQIAAFRRRDAPGAWKHVAPGLQVKFGTPEGFLRMVVIGYAPVADPQSYRFGELVVLESGELGQWMDVVGPDGARVQALYLLEKQPDGTWRTSGCLLFAPGDDRPAV